jgi:hypothetical protein
MGRAIFDAVIIEPAIPDIRYQETLTSKAAPTGPSGPIGASSLMPDRTSCRDPSARYSV